jgi:hypothetical protein
MIEVTARTQGALRFYRALSSLLGLLVLFLALMACREDREVQADRAVFLDAHVISAQDVSPDGEMTSESEPMEVQANRIILLDGMGNPGIILTVGGTGPQTALVIQDGRGREIMRLGAPSLRPISGTG